MTVIQSGVDTTLAEVDDTYKALPIISKSVETINYNQSDFSLDSFQRLRVSQSNIIFEYTFGALTPALATSIWESTAFGAGTETLTTNLYGLDLSTTTATATGRWIQTFSHIKITPGISTLLRFTFNFNKSITNLRQRIGMFTDQGTFPSIAGDGVYLENDSGVLSVVRRYTTQGLTGTEERVNQSEWNLDSLDSTGTSGIKLDITKSQHLVIEYTTLGTIRVGFDMGSFNTIWCHEFNTSNNTQDISFGVFALPIRVECYSYGGLTIPGRLTLINCVVQQEGIVNKPSRYFGATTGTGGRGGSTVLGSLYPLISISPKSTNNATKVNTVIIPVSVDLTIFVAGTGTTSLQVALLMLPTPNTGGTFLSTIPGSNCEYDLAATSTTAITGTIIWSAVIPNVVGRYSFDLSKMSFENSNKVGFNAAGTVSIFGSSIITLACGPLTGATTASASISASLNWKEQ